LADLFQELQFDFVTMVVVANFVHPKRRGT
jgi:hypothetical protein